MKKLTLAQAKKLKEGDILICIKNYRPLKIGMECKFIKYRHSGYIDVLINNKPSIGWDCLRFALGCKKEYSLSRLIKAANKGRKCANILISKHSSDITISNGRYKLK